jgi:hypothetical protein
MVRFKDFPPTGPLRYSFSMSYLLRWRGWPGGSLFRGGLPIRGFDYGYAALGMYSALFSFLHGY